MPGLIQRIFAKKQNLPHNGISRDIQRRQQLLADALQRASKKLSRKTLSVFLFIYCTAFGFAFLSITINAFKLGDNRTSHVYKMADSVRGHFHKARPPNRK